MAARWCQDGLDAFVEGMRPEARRFRVPVETIRDALRPLPMLTFFVDDRPVGAAVFTASETHLSILPEYHGRWLTPKALRAFRTALSDRPKARIRADNVIARRFVERLGMTHIETVDGWSRYELRR